MRYNKLLIFGIVIFLLSPHKLYATDYYISTNGNDSNSGASSSLPWKTIAKMSSRSYNAGDTINFEGGREFVGKIYLSSSSSGLPSNPIQIRSYGLGRATIKNTSDNAFMAYNTAGIYLHDLNFVGPGSSNSAQIDGVAFYMDLGNNTKLPFIKVENIDISGWSNYLILGLILRGLYSKATIIFHQVLWL